MKVMIVDDNAEMRLLIRSLLRDTVQEFVECRGGNEAVAAFPIERPDWTLMDILMPGGDGLAATRLIRAQFPQARILVVTQHDNIKFRELAHDAGATGFLGKDDLTRLDGIISEAS